MIRDARAFLYVVDRARSFRIERSRRISPTVCSNEELSAPSLPAAMIDLRLDRSISPTGP